MGSGWTCDGYVDELCCARAPSRGVTDQENGMSSADETITHNNEQRVVHTRDPHPYVSLGSGPKRRGEKMKLHEVKMLAKTDSAG